MAGGYRADMRRAFIQVTDPIVCFRVSGFPQRGSNLCVTGLPWLSLQASLTAVFSLLSTASALPLQKRRAPL